MKPGELGHRCPGCGERIPFTRFACLVDWRRLPLDLRRPVSATARRTLLDPERRAIVQDARRWYRENPRGAS